MSTCICQNGLEYDSADITRDCSTRTLSIHRLSIGRTRSLCSPKHSVFPTFLSRLLTFACAQRGFDLILIMLNNLPRPLHLDRLYATKDEYAGPE
jgi:hypothetical protein